MAHLSQQASFPYTFARGQFSGSSHTVAIPSGFDGILRRIWVMNYGGSNPSNVYVQDSNTALLFNAEVPAYANAGYVLDEEGLYVVLNSITSLVLNYPSTGSFFWSIEGDLFTPGTAVVLPT